MIQFFFCSIFKCPSASRPAFIKIHLTISIELIVTGTTSDAERLSTSSRLATPEVALGDTILRRKYAMRRSSSLVQKEVGSISKTTSNSEDQFHKNTANDEKRNDRQCVQINSTNVSEREDSNFLPTVVQTTESKKIPEVDSSKVNLQQSPKLQNQKLRDQYKHDRRKVRTHLDSEARSEATDSKNSEITEKFKETLVKLQKKSQIKVFKHESEEIRQNWELKRKHSPEEEMEKTMPKGSQEKKTYCKINTDERIPSLPRYMSPRRNQKTAVATKVPTHQYKLDESSVSTIGGNTTRDSSRDPSPYKLTPRGDTQQSPQHRKLSQRVELSTKKVELKIHQKNQTK